MEATQLEEDLGEDTFEGFAVQPMGLEEDVDHLRDGHQSSMTAMMTRTGMLRETLRLKVKKRSKKILKVPVVC